MAATGPGSVAAGDFPPRADAGGNGVAGQAGSVGHGGGTALRQQGKSARTLQSVDLAAQAMGVDPQTARHYMDAKKAFDGTAVLGKLAAALDPSV